MKYNGWVVYIVGLLCDYCGDGVVGGIFGDGDVVEVSIDLVVMFGDLLCCGLSIFDGSGVGVFRC